MGKSSIMSNMAPGLGFGVGAGLSNAGGTTVTVCNGANASSFYCEFVQFFNIFKMLLLIIVVIMVIYWFATSFSKTVRKSRR